jgi:hypothetical protein
MTRKSLRTKIKFKDETYQLRIIVDAPPHVREDILRLLENKLLQRGVMV